MSPCDVPQTVRLSRHTPYGLAGDAFEQPLNDYVERLEEAIR
jgi:hypothetical protein